ncbi:MAG: hypothetical protein WCI73_06640 [Phycisphaerae bacterium]
METHITKKQTILLVSGVIILVVLLASTPFALRAVLLCWARHNAWQAMHKISPETLHNMEAVPTRITLPTPDNSIPAIETTTIDSYVIRYPVPQTKEIRSKTLLLTYPQFIVIISPPFSTRDFDDFTEKTVHQNYATHLRQVYHVRPSDIDNQKDLTLLKELLVKLSEKITRFAYATYFTEFEQMDRCGFIVAVDDKFNEIASLTFFTKTASAAWIRFSSKSGVNPNDVVLFLATVQIEPHPVATKPTTSP